MRSTVVRGGVQVTQVGLGGAALGNLGRERSDAEAHQLVDAAWEAGARYFDTAPHYGLGLSEERMGAALAGRDRSEFVVSTKVGRLLVPSPQTRDRWDDEGFRVAAARRRQWDFSRDGVRRSLDDSLARLGLSSVDIVYLHDPDDHGPAASTTGIQALLELREEGVVGAIGLGMNQVAMLTDFIRRFDVDVVMVAGRYTLLDRSAEAELLPLALERGVSVVAAGVFNSGLLALPEVPSDAHFDYRPAPEPVVARARALAGVCRDFGTTLPHAALQFPLRHPAVSSLVLGAGTPAQVQEGVAQVHDPLPEGLWAALDETVRRP